MTIAELLEKIEELTENYEYVGIRAQERHEFSIGLVDHVSHNFESRDLFGSQDCNGAEELDGISDWKVNDYCSASKNAVEIIDNCIKYYNHCAILASNYAESGMDEDEIVMRDAEVVCIIK